MRRRAADAGVPDGRTAGRARGRRSARDLCWLFAPVGLVAVVIVTVSSVQGASLSFPVSFAHADKVAHAAEFGLLGLLLVRALWWSTRWSFTRVAGVCVALGGGFGALDELHQRMVPGRQMDGWDLAADAAGLLAACAVWYLIIGRRATAAEPAGREPPT